MAMLISDKTHFNIKDVTRDKEKHYIMIKELTDKADINLSTYMLLTTQFQNAWSEYRIERWNTHINNNN